ncbi:alpha/beta fold hydrolase [Clostridium sp. Cult1]|uniref:alpha/beta fold hydrolase n=1 Tax=Clostridium sp. Cult1 TaxID=2079002 RepID=UPI001F16489F|nr:alpha/beta hydrolase [Clostridium sp. Cult1]MCF6461990.1 hydrolase [Clostridium sp. Cult1]
MFHGAKEGKVKVGRADMDYVAFGSGQKAFIIIPGLGDGLKTVKGTKVLLSRMYKLFAKEYKVYVFSRKNSIEEGYSIRDMAEDQKIAMENLGIKNAHIMGVSQGGMISQYVAIDYPEMVDKLVIGVSVSKQNDTMQKVIKNWITLAENNDYRNLIIDTMEKTFTEDKLKKYRVLYPIITRVGRPKDFKRFVIQANACLNHNAYDELGKIKCSTLVIGGDSDKVVGKNASREMAERIDDSKLILYRGLGHGAYEEAEDFNQQVLKFLKIN